MKNHWLFREVEGKHIALGDAEKLIPLADRPAILDAIPHGWRLTRYDASQWTFSRLVSTSIPFKVIHVVEAIVSRVLRGDDTKKQLPKGWSSAQNALFTCGPEDTKPLLSVIGNVLKHGSGSCGVYKDDGEDIYDDFAKFAKPNPFDARDDLMSLELSMTVPTVSSLELHNVCALRESVLDKGFPIHPSFDGESLAYNVGGLMALHLALHAVGTCAMAAHESEYNVAHMREWWFDHAYRKGGVESVRILAQFTDGQPVEMMTIACMKVCSSLYPTIVPICLFMRDVLPICAYAFLVGVERHSDQTYIKDYAMYLCRDDESAERVLRSMGMIFAASYQIGVEEGLGNMHLPDCHEILSMLSGGDRDEIAQAFVDVAPFGSFAYKQYEHAKTLLGVSKDRVGVTCGALPEEILQLIFLDDALVKEYYKFNQYNVKGLNKNLLAPDSIWDGEGSLTNIMEGL